MSIIVPAVLPRSREDLDMKLARFEGLVDAVQVDIVDGLFAEPACWPYTGDYGVLARIAAGGGSMPHVEDFRFDMDLMVERPEEVVGSWIALGASRITVHIESTTYVPRIVTDFKEKYGHEKGFAPGLLSFGFAINLDTDPTLLEPYISDIDYVQFMGIRSIGKQGQPFDQRVLERIKTFKKKHPDICVQIDGGVTLETTPALLAAGADRLVVGSALLNAPDLKAELAKFTALTEEYGLYN